MVLIHGREFRGVCTGIEEGLRVRESSLFVTLNYFRFLKKVADTRISKTLGKPDVLTR